jgi:hypothetical protein
MFVTLGGFYLVEASQALAVVWFIFMMARAPGWNPAYTLCHLIGASAFAFLTKTTTPLFCLWPGLITLWILVRQATVSRRAEWAQGRVVAAGALSLAVAVPTVSWYYRNWYRAITHARASSGPIAAAWGKEDTFFNTFVYWLLEVPRSFYYAPVVALVVAALILAAIFSRRSKLADFDVAFTAALLQSITVLGVFAFASNREARLVLPLLPYFGLMVCWSVDRLGNPLLNGAAILGSGGQLVLVYALAFGLFWNSYSYPVRPIDTTGRNQRILKSIVARTCGASDGARYLDVVAIDPVFRGDWLAPEPANYVAGRDFGRGPQAPPCDYGYLGRGFFGSSAAVAWEALITDRVRYVVTTDPAVYPEPGGRFNEALEPENFRLFWTNLTTSGLFAREAPLAEDPGLAVFRRLGFGDRD